MARFFRQAAAVAALMVASLARADETIAIDEADPPFMYVVDGKPAGIYPALLTEAFRRMGVGLLIRPMPWKRVVAGSEAGETGAAGLSKNAQRLTKFDFSDQLFEEVIMVYVRKGMAFPLNSPQALNGKIVGVVRGWSYGDEFNDAVKAGKITAVECGWDTENFERLLAGRLDVVLSSLEIAHGIIADGHLQAEIEELPNPLVRSPGYLAFAKTAGKTEEIALFNRVLAAIHQDGTFDKLIAGKPGE